MKQVRVDRGALRKPKRAGSALVIEGHAARTHAPGDPLRYAHGDEYRDATELQRIAEQLVGKPVTKRHPKGLIADGAKAKIVGRVDAAWVDGEHVAVRLRIGADAALAAGAASRLDAERDARDAIADVEAGTKELSLGYGTTLDDANYQRDTDVDHLAIVPSARCGETCAMRVDAIRLDCTETCACVKERADRAFMTSAVDGHQHLVDLNPPYGDCMSGETSWAKSEGQDGQHSHPWVRNSDGTITIGESEGHTHAIIDGRADAHQIDRHHAITESASMADKTDKQRADELETTVSTLRAEITRLEGLIAVNATAGETEALRKEKQRADAADKKVRDLEAAFQADVRARCALLVEAGQHLGGAVRFDDMTERQIHEAVIKRLDASVNTSAENDDQVRGRYQTLIALAARNGESQQRVAEILRRDPEKRADGGGDRGDDKSYEDIQNNRWKQTLKNGRAAAEGR